MTDFVEDYEEVGSYRGVFLTAIATMLCLTVAATGWGMYAHLDSAVVAKGVLLAESERKTVENLEGGILEKLLVKQGDRVTKGEIVATLDATQTREQLEQFRSDWTSQTFDIWRLEAEEAGAQKLDPAKAPDIPEPERSARIEAQTQLFEARLRAHIGQIASLRRQIDQLKGQIAANEGQARASERQIKLWNEERAATQTLVDKGATPKQKLLELDRTIALLEGDLDEAHGLIASARDQIARSGVDIETLRQQRAVEIGEKLSEARRLADGLASRMRAAEDVLERHNMRAPQDGLVVDIKIKTPGAIVGSGVPLMDIVPNGDQLVVQTRIPPETIDTVHVGRPAKVKLIAYPRAQSPVLMGEVFYVSADMLEDPKDGSAYFEARVRMDLSGLKELPYVHLAAGMPVEVAIQTGERRAGEYILAPILRRLGNALREE